MAVGTKEDTVVVGGWVVVGRGVGGSKSVELSGVGQKSIGSLHFHRMDILLKSKLNCEGF